MKIYFSFLFLILALSLTGSSSFAEESNRITFIKKSDLPDGYYLVTQTKSNIKDIYTEVWSTMSPAVEKYYTQKYGSLVHAPPASSISIERFHYSNGIDQSTVNYHKGASIAPGWIETTPGGKKIGDKCFSINFSSPKGDKLCNIIIVKGSFLYLIKIMNRKGSKSIPKDSAEKLIETIYSRL
jgi:hypothetical protein